MLFVKYAQTRGCMGRIDCFHVVRITTSHEKIGKIILTREARHHLSQVCALLVMDTLLLVNVDWSYWRFLGRLDSQCSA